RTVGTTRVVRGGRLRPGSAARTLFIVLYLGFLLLPLYWVAVTSIKPQEDLLADPPVWWPHHPSGLHYSTALNAFRGRAWLGISLVDTQIGLILLYTVFALPFTVWMMFAYFRQMPVELEEAALVDGCSRLQALWKIACPLAAPGIVSAAAFAFILSWTEF